MDYDEMLERALEQTPDNVVSESRFTPPEPETRIEGSVTVFENLKSTADYLNREVDSLKKFFQTELATSINIDDSGNFRFTGEFEEERINNLLQDYVEKYVLCSECGSPDTNLIEERGIQMLRCTACGARQST